MSFITHEEIIEIYLKKINLKSIEELNDQNSFNIIKIAYQDFRDEKLSFDDFSTLGEYLFNKLSSGMTRSSSYGSILLEIAELSDFIRIWNPNDNFINLTSALTSIDEYFRNH